MTESICLIGYNLNFYIIILQFIYLTPNSKQWSKDGLCGTGCAHGGRVLTKLIEGPRVTPKSALILDFPEPRITQNTVLLFTRDLFYEIFIIEAQTY